MRKIWPLNIPLRVVVGISLALAVCIALVWYVRLDPDPQHKAVVVHSEDAPAETPITDDYQVPADQPRSIEIQSVGIKGFIQKVGIDQHRAIAVPNNINLAGWFVDSALPGQKGLSIIDGHFGSSTPAVFSNLKKVSKDDKIVVTFGDGRQVTYIAFDTHTLSASDAPQYLFEQNPGVSSQLNLITCGGSYNKQDRSYADRVIVYARLDT